MWRAPLRMETAKHANQMTGLESRGSTTHLRYRRTKTTLPSMRHTDSSQYRAMAILAERKSGTPPAQRGLG